MLPGGSVTLIGPGDAFYQRPLGEGPCVMLEAWRLWDWGVFTRAV